jgi:hypothetical protein
MYRTMPLFVLCAALASSPLGAADPVSEMKTHLAERGKLLLAADFSQSLASDWRTAKGKWEIVDGVLRGAELKADNHAAATRHALPSRNVVIQYAIKLDGARQTTLSINDAKGHCCRLLVNASGFAVQKDSHDHNVKDKAVVLARQPVPLKAGEWHTIVVEIVGSEILACLDGATFAYGMHESIDVDKANFGLTVAGEAVSFKNLRVWEGVPNKDWEATKTKLLDTRQKQAAK